jgi:hypothetical protein
VAQTRSASQTPGVPDLHVGGLEPRGDPRERGRRIERQPGIDGRRHAVPAQEWPDERRIVVARDEHHLGVASQLRPQRAQHRLGRLQSLRRASLEQLDHVAEQDQALDVLQRREQRVERLGALQHAPVQAGAEMEIGYHERAHGAIFSVRPEPMPLPRYL